MLAWRRHSNSDDVWKGWSGRHSAELQLQRLNALLTRILPLNRFYAAKFPEMRLPLESLEQFHELPYTCKDELVTDGPEGDFAANVTYPLDQYARYHRTSGTRGRPLAVVDTAEDWSWWIDIWQFVLDAAEVNTHDRVCMAFSFGPFIGFWSAYDAASARGALVVPGGGMGTLGPSATDTGEPRHGTLLHSQLRAAPRRSGS